ncbi:hypothetical protein Micbo1qcDRAFT_208056 [Microdochium bolleyi]|uniref:Uncharacterized protein n=1 Tax=Microdochium bolleyi TaxID=196109 RepID=A0A136IR94_9PEZI|nr:hypothetical protein Micbo1qcDRAFT_208056 [Microdochium bolleyi]
MLLEILLVFVVAFVSIITYVYLGYMDAQIDDFRDKYDDIFYTLKLLHSVFAVGKASTRPVGMDAGMLSNDMEKFTGCIPEHDELIESITMVLYFSSIHRIALDDMMLLADKIHYSHLRIQNTQANIANCQMAHKLPKSCNMDVEEYIETEHRRIAQCHTDLKIKCAHQALALEQILRSAPKMKTRMASIRGTNVEFGLALPALQKDIEDYCKKHNFHILWDWRVDTDL